MLEGADFQDGSPPGARLLPGPLEQHSCRACTEGPSLRKGGCLLCATPLPHPGPPVGQSCRLPLFGREGAEQRNPNFPGKEAVFRGNWGPSAANLKFHPNWASCL